MALPLLPNGSWEQSKTPNRTLLLVEDNEDIRELLATALRRFGYTVAEAEHGKVALEMIDAMDSPPALILLDLMMPVMSGPELLSVLQHRGMLASVPVVIISAIVDHERPNGARAYVRKPLSEDLLLKLVNEFCGPPST